eukprot:6662469-Pyramimonas_sp.AAC.1
MGQSSLPAGCPQCVPALSETDATPRRVDACMLTNCSLAQHTCASLTRMCASRDVPFCNARHHPRSCCRRLYYYNMFYRGLKVIVVPTQPVQ